MRRVEEGGSEWRVGGEQSPESDAGMKSVDVGGVHALQDVSLHDEDAACNNLCIGVAARKSEWSGLKLSELTERRVKTGAE